jgi:oligopeptide transport system substrate-binding protein
VRRAFALAVDRETLVDVSRRGYQLPATGGFVPPGMPGHSADIGLPYDPDQARQLLAEAGYAGGGGFPAVQARMGGLVDSEVEHLRVRWRANLGVEVRRYDESGQEPPHLSVRTWLASYPDPDEFLRGPFLLYGTGWRNETYTRLVEEARRLMVQDERMKLYKEADKILIEEAAVMPLFYGRYHMLARPWVRKYPVCALKWCFWKDVIIEPH